jgi:hypothetical protein
MAHRTKWEILSARVEKARKELEDLESYMRGMENTPDNTKCSFCAEQFRTNADFAKHFVIPNETYLNLGECPHMMRCGNCNKRMDKRELADFCSQQCWDSYHGWDDVEKGDAHYASFECTD